MAKSTCALSWPTGQRVHRGAKTEVAHHLEHDTTALHAVHFVCILFGWLFAFCEGLNLSFEQIGGPLVHLALDELEIVFDQVLLLAIEQRRFQKLRRYR